MTRIAFAWPGMPDYAARCIRAVVDREEQAVLVVATRPNVPIKGMEQSLGQLVHWVTDKNPPTTWLSLGVPVPDMLFCGGYATRAFSLLCREVRAKGGRVVLMSDHSWQDGLRGRILEPLRHWLLYRRLFDGILVPGASGLRVARSWGYDDLHTATKLYGADPDLFHGGPPLAARPKTFLFVGQFIARKKVLDLTQAFLQFSETHSEWTLSLCGSGAQVNAIPRHPQISVHGFVQPPQLAELLRQVRCLILPSREEHWGLVVHEAALSGCALALSETVGAADDLARPENAIIFPSGKVEAMYHAMSEIAAWDADRWRRAEATSRRLADGFGPQAFASSVASLVDQFRENHHK